MKINTKIMIEISARTEDDALRAFDEAVKLILEGYTAGHDSNEYSSFLFELRGDTLGL